MASPIIMGSIKPADVERSGEREIKNELVVELTNAVNAAKTMMVRSDRPAMSAVSSNLNAENNRIAESTPHAANPLNMIINTVEILTTSIAGMVSAAPSINPITPGIPKSNTAIGRNAAGRKTRLTRGATSAASKI